MLLNKFFTNILVKLQYFLPQHLLSQLFGWLGKSKSSMIKNLLIRFWVWHFKIDMNEATDKNIRNYRCFNDFFTRRLKKGVRVCPEDEKLVISPVDGIINQIGVISAGRIIQAKKFNFSITELLGGYDYLAEDFVTGEFINLYLSPRHYHRVHMPCSGYLVAEIYIPGSLFSVNKATWTQVPNLFARNERLVCIFNTCFGSMAMILVGAMLVSGIETVWNGLIKPTKRMVTQYHDKNMSLSRFAEMGKFNAGSTVIMLFSKNFLQWNNINLGSEVFLGQTLAKAKYRSQ